MATKTNIAPVGSVLLNRLLAVAVKDQKILLVRTGAGLFALEDVCPHQSRPLHTGTVEKGLVRCKNHGVAIDPANGTIVYDAGFLALQPVQVFPCFEENGAIWVEL